MAASAMKFINVDDACQHRIGKSPEYICNREIEEYGQ